MFRKTNGDIYIAWQNIDQTLFSGYSILA